MAQPYVGEIRMFAGNFAPAGWMFCEGQILSIAENDTLFNLIGTTYGGDGQSTFALPDLRGRAPVHSGPAFLFSQSLGQESVALSLNQMPNHSHNAMAATNATAAKPTGAIVGDPGAAIPIYHPATGLGAVQPLVSTTLQPTGSGQPHENRQPYLCVDFIISLFGIFPSQT